MPVQAKREIGSTGPWYAADVCAAHLVIAACCGIRTIRLAGFGAMKARLRFAGGDGATGFWRRKAYSQRENTEWMCGSPTPGSRTADGDRI